jgi:hypothetical protein
MEKYLAFKTIPGNIQAKEAKYRSSYPAIPSKEVCDYKVYKIISDPANPVIKTEYTSRLHSSIDAISADLITNVLSAEYDILYSLPTYYCYRVFILKSKKDNKLYIADEVWHCSDDAKNNFISRWELSEIKEVKARVSTAQRKKEELEQHRQSNKTLFDTFVLPALTKMVQGNGLKIKPVPNQVNTYEIYVYPDTLNEHLTEALKKVYPGVNFKKSNNNSFYQTTRLCTFKADDFMNCIQTTEE